MGAAGSAISGWRSSAAALSINPTVSAIQEMPIVRSRMLKAIKVPYTAIKRNALAHTPANWIMARRRAAPIDLLVDVGYARYPALVTHATCQAPRGRSSHR